MSSVGLGDCDAMVLIGQRRVLSTALQRNQNLPHTCWMNCLALSSNSVAFNSCVVYCFFATALSPLITLETAQRERSVLLLGDKRLLKEGRSVDLLCNQKGNYESLKLILIRLNACASRTELKRDAHES